MFNCQKCGKTTAAGEPATKQVVSVRMKSYRNVVKIKERVEDGEGGDERSTRPVRRRDVRPQYVETQGTEIAKEILICNKCAGIEMVKAAPAEAGKDRAVGWWSPGLIPGIRL